MPPGRPTKLTPELHDQIIGSVRAGNYIETACQAAGIDKKSLYDWFKRGNGGEEPFRRFLDACKSAWAEAEITDLGRIEKAAAEGVWQASAWRLERKFPDRWGRFDRVRVSGDPDQPIGHEVKHTIAGPAPETIAAVAQLLFQARGLDLPDPHAGRTIIDAPGHSAAPAGDHTAPAPDRDATDGGGGDTADHGGVRAGRAEPVHPGDPAPQTGVVPFAD